MINEFLINYHREELDLLKRQFDHEIHFLDALPYLQCQVPRGELEKIVGDGIYSKTVREFNPVSKEFGQPCDIKPLLKKFASSHKKVMDEGYSFAFYGHNGSGKSMASLYLLCSMIEKGYSGYYIFFKDYMHLHNKALYNNDNQEWQKDMKLLNHIQGCDLLVLDEVGKESKTSENVISAFEGLIKNRSNSNLPTVICTNLSFSPQKAIEMFDAKYGNSVYDVMMEKYRIFHFKSSGNFRAKGRKEWDL